MNPGPAADALYLDQILERIASIRKGVETLSLDAFRSDRDKVDATAFRLAMIGEASHKLSGEFKARHPGIPWELIYRQRNIVVHAYDSIKAEVIWAVVNKDLDLLEAVCRDELKRLDS